ncbi:hypothetical protein K2173_026478 [Erythroxylum novogranatense]|uniref:RING-type E3 ubiquitin transferase n=1 Tax=Erythroxylum novogranatense TaxID=1862640 RepID=A0AAV8TXN3_9ROSI|nr:hypothetical protein K2173_026478 [Erythroxylum novogranatense]
MTSVSSQNPWPPYDAYRDCSQAICSVYCPQWCYIIFPPPPPFNIEDDGSGTDFSPLIIALIGILASAFILISYYTIISKYCWRRGQADGRLELSENRDQITSEPWQGTAIGLDEALIKSITLFKYRRGDGFFEGTDCSVCLTEFQENESLRLLPKCSHAFHVPCIDTWLRSHASCPLCRASIVSANILPPQPNQEIPTHSSNAVSLQFQHRTNDAVSVVQDSQSGNFREEFLLTLVVDDEVPKNSTQDVECVEGTEPIDIEVGQDHTNQMIRRSVSLNFSACQSQTSIADILRVSEEDDSDDCQVRDSEKYRGGILNLARSPLAMRRSISAGRLVFTRFEKGRSSEQI